MEKLLKKLLHTEEAVAPEAAPEVARRSCSQKLLAEVAPDSTATCEGGEEAEATCEGGEGTEEATEEVATEEAAH